MEQLKGVTFLYGSLGICFTPTEIRLRIRDTASRLIDEDRLQPFADLAKRYVGSPLFWFMAIFAFNTANIKRRSTWITAALPLTMIAALADSLWMAVVSGNPLAIMFALVLLFFLPSLLGIAMEASIQSEPDSDEARFRCWLMIQARKTGIIPATLKEVSSNLVSLLRPYSEEEYRAKAEVWHKWARGGFWAMLVMMGVLFGLVAIGAPFMNNFWVSTPLVVLTFSMLGPMVIAEWFESSKKPVLHADPSLVIPDAYGGVSEPTIQEVTEAFRSPRVWRGMKVRAWLLYLFGPLFAWDTEGFPMVGISFMLVVLYALARSSVAPANLEMLNIVMLFVPLLMGYAIWSAWRDGGGIAKAMERKDTYHDVTRAKSFDQIIEQTKVLDSFQLGEYATPARKATRDQVVASLYIRSIPSWSARKSLLRNDNLREGSARE